MYEKWLAAKSEAVYSFGYDWDSGELGIVFADGEGNVDTYWWRGKDGREIGIYGYVYSDVSEGVFVVLKEANLLIAQGKIQSLGWLVNRLIVYNDDYSYDCRLMNRSEIEEFVDDTREEILDPYDF